MLNKEMLGEENLDKHLFEGDMVLSPQQQREFESLKKDVPSQTTDDFATKRALIKKKKFLWENNTVGYAIHKSVDAKGRSIVAGAIKHWENKTCLKFTNDTKKSNDSILFVFAGGCWSRVGRVGGMQKISIGSPKAHCTKGNIIHEIGHAMGFFHEQSRPDRDTYVHVMLKNIMPSYIWNFHKFNNTFIDSRNVPYDYNSIMHYGGTFFSRFAPLLPTILTTEEGKTTDGHRPFIGQRLGLSALDVIQANLLYKCDGRKRLTDNQRVGLEAEMNDDPTLMDSVPCSDTYNQNTCLAVKKMGYCEKYPRTLKDACGITCNMCSINRRTVPTPDEQGKKRAFSKLKQQLEKKPTN